LSPHLKPATEAILREPEWPCAPYHPAEPGQFRAYIDAIHAFDRVPFDVILIDGRARIDCPREAARCQKPGGLLFFHNLRLRERYHGQTQIIYTRYRLREALTSTPQTLALFEKR
jgi:predicted O-methyltransferase YrrM